MEDRQVGGGGERIDSRDSSASSRSEAAGLDIFGKRHDGLLDAAELGGVFCRGCWEGERANESKYSEETLEGTSKVKYLERLRNLDLKEFACQKELMEVQVLMGVAESAWGAIFLRDDHGDGGSDRCPEEGVLWIDKLSTPKQAREFWCNRGAFKTPPGPGQIKGGDTGGGETSRSQGYGASWHCLCGFRLVERCKIRRWNWTSKLARALATYDRSDLRAALVIIVAGSDFAVTSGDCADRKLLYTTCRWPNWTRCWLWWYR